MAIQNINFNPKPEKGVSYSAITDSSVDWTGVTNSTYFYDKATDLPYYKNASGTVVSLFEEGGGGSDTFVTGGTYTSSASTITLNRNDGNSVSISGITSGGGSSDTLYTADGTLTGDRIVDLDNNKLTFDIGNGVADGVIYDGSTITNTNISLVQYKGVGTNNILSMGETGLLSNQGVTDTTTLRLTNTSNGGIIINNSTSGIYAGVTEFRQATTTSNTRLRHYLDSTRAETQFYNSSNDLVHHITLGTPFACSFFRNGVVGGFVVGSNAVIGSEDISLQGDTLISKKLELSTTTDGFLMPRLTTAQKNAISSPDTNLMVFDTDLSSLQRYNGSAWVDVAGGSDTFVTGGTYSGSTIVLNRNDGNSVDVTGITSSNIYTADGTLSGDRTVNLGTANDLIFENSGSSTNFKLNNASSGYVLNNRSGGIKIRPVAAGNQPLVISNTSDNFDTFTVKANGGGLWSAYNGIKIGELTTNDYANFTIYDLEFRKSNVIKHKIGFGENGSDVDFWVGGVSANNSFRVGGGSLINGEAISFQGDTLISKKLELSTTDDGFLMPRLTTAQMNAISSPDTHLSIFNTDLNCVMRYNGAAWTTFDTPKYVLKNGNTHTPYSSLYTAINNATSGSTIDINVSETVDCGGVSTWTWGNDITINFNGHHTIFSNLDRIVLAAGVSLGISNGTFEMASSSINTGAIMFSGGNTVKGDGAINVFQNTGGSARGSFQHNSGTAPNYISGVIMKGSYSFCVSGGAARIYIDNCILYTDLSTNDNALYGDNIEISNSTIYGKAFSISGGYTIPSRETVRVFNNCTIISDGESAIGSRSAIFNGCTITTNDDEVRIGIGGEQEYYNCKLERTGTVGLAFVITNTSNVRMYHTQIISTGAGVSTNLPMEFYNCYIKANGGAGISNTNGAGMIIRGGTIDSTGGSTLLFSTANVSGIAEVSNVTLVCNTTGKHCLEVGTNTTLTFSNLSMKNTATSTDIYSRAGILSENLQIETTDAFGNIILK